MRGIFYWAIVDCRLSIVDWMMGDIRLR